MITEVTTNDAAVAAAAKTTTVPRNLQTKLDVRGGGHGGGGNEILGSRFGCKREFIQLVI